MNESFYKDLKGIDDFSDLYDMNIYKEAPEDWYLIATDIQNSTSHIKKGMYKEVNMVASMCIVSIININRDLEIPYIFGGDGAFLLVPNKNLHQIKQSLLAVKKLSLEAYDLQLRVGLISLEELRTHNKKVFLSKFKSTKKYSQALICGNGIDYFDYLLKKDDTYRIKDKFDENFKLDLEGLECRWNYIKSSKDKSISLILKCHNQQEYKRVLEKVEHIIGSFDSRHPIKSDLLNLTFDKKLLNIEASILAKKGFSKFITTLKLKLINFLGLVLMNNRIGQWAKYKDLIVQTTDIQKYDNTVRMIFSASNEELKSLKSFLEQEYKNKNLIFGLHESKYSIMTCLIFERHNKHIHFVDTANGGYCAASQEYKKRLNS